MTAAGRWLVVAGGEPAGTAAALGQLPGVDWVALGEPVRTLSGLGDAASSLARRYLKGGASFAVRPDAEGPDARASDVGGAVTAAVLGAGVSARVDDRGPDRTFRAVFGRGGGAVGVELRRGPGGTATGGATAECLVSGGLHSAALAWHALLCGYRVRMLHEEAGEESLLAVARLYAELSHRVDPRSLALEVSGPGSARSALRRRPGGRPPMAGFHAECGGVPAGLEGLVTAPLLLATEEELRASADGLDAGSPAGRFRWRAGESPRSPRTVSGRRLDAHGVLQELSRQRA